MSGSAKIPRRRSTLFDHTHRRSKLNHRERRLALSFGHEKSIFQLLSRHGDQGVPLTQLYLAEAASTFIQTLPSPTREKFPCRKGRPGVIWLRKFAKRLHAEQKYAQPDLQEAK